jgi:peptidoglycan hydrolase-like protein with peptidoglycan-binding domain
MKRRRGASTADRTSRTIRRQRVVMLIAIGCAVLSTAGLVSARFVKSPLQVRVEASAPEPSVITAKVTRQVLSTTLVFRGAVGTASRLEVTPSLPQAAGANAAIVTAVRVHAGETIKAGGVLLEVAGRPLIALPGAVPTYRDLKPGDSGADVRQLQRALRSLGYFRATADGTFGTATKDAVSRLYRAIGYEVPTTGGPQGARDRQAIQAAADAVAGARRAVDDMERRIAAEAARPSPRASAAEPVDEPLDVQLRYLKQALRRAIDKQRYLLAHTGPRADAFSHGETAGWMG